MVVVAIMVSALAGGILAGILGWLQQQPPIPFSGRSFAINVIVSLFGAVGIAYAFDYFGITSLVLAYLLAFLSGAGITAGGSRLVGAFAARIIGK
jgi:hypothetical protein